MSAPEARFELLDEQSPSELHAINRACPIQADFTFYFDRTPDFFVWPRVHFDSARYTGIFVGERLVGYGMYGLRTGTLGGRTVRYFYLGDWRVLPEMRGQDLGRRAAEWLLDQLPEDVNTGFGLVKRGNQPVEHIMRSPGSATWTVHSLGPFTALNIVPVWGPRGRRECAVEPAGPADLDEIANVMEEAWGGRPFAPDRLAIEHSLEELPLPGLELSDHYVARRRGRIVGLVAAWNRTSFHRATVLGYSRRGGLLRSLLGFGRPLVRHRLPALPAPGEPLSALTLTRVAIPGRDPFVLRDLLGAVIDRARGHHHLLHLGLPSYDPLLTAGHRLLKQLFVSELHLFTRGPVPENLDDPRIDLAMI